MCMSLSKSVLFILKSNVSWRGITPKHNWLRCPRRGHRLALRISHNISSVKMHKIKASYIENRNTTKIEQIAQSLNLRSYQKLGEKSKSSYKATLILRWPNLHGLGKGKDYRLVQPHVLSKGTYTSKTF